MLELGPGEVEAGTDRDPGGAGAEVVGRDNLAQVVRPVEVCLLHLGRHGGLNDRRHRGAYGPHHGRLPGAVRAVRGALEFPQLRLELPVLPGGVLHHVQQHPLGRLHPVDVPLAGQDVDQPHHQLAPEHLHGAVLVQDGAHHGGGGPADGASHPQ